MLKLRVTFADDETGNEELEKFKSHIQKNYKILNISKVYKGRGGRSAKNIYSNVYMDIEN